MSVRRLISFAAIVLAAGAAGAQTSDLSDPGRQERMDRALENYRGHAALPGDAAKPSTGRSVGNDLREFGRNFVRDAKRAPGQLAEAGRQTGHDVAKAARQTGRDAKAAAHDAKQSVTGSGS